MTSSYICAYCGVAVFETTHKCQNTFTATKHPEFVSSTKPPKRFFQFQRTGTPLVNINQIESWSDKGVIAGRKGYLTPFYNSSEYARFLKWVESHGVDRAEEVK